MVVESWKAGAQKVDQCLLGGDVSRYEERAFVCVMTGPHVVSVHRPLVQQLSRRNILNEGSIRNGGKGPCAICRSICNVDVRFLENFNILAAKAK